MTDNQNPLEPSGTDADDTKPSDGPGISLLAYQYYGSCGLVISSRNRMSPNAEVYTATCDMEGNDDISHVWIATGWRRVARTPPGDLIDESGDDE